MFKSVLLMLVLTLASTASATASQSPLETVRLLVGSGTLVLALKMVEEGQPPRVADALDQWIAWERERLRIYRKKEDWTQIISRVDQYPKGLPADFLVEALTHKAQGLLEIGQAAAARKILSVMIWSAKAEGNAEQFALWRRMITRCYQLEGLPDDANMAMLRYQLDYPMEGEDWALQRARLLLIAGRPAQAAEVLALAKSVEGNALLLLAKVRAGQEDLPGILAAARAALDKPGLKPAQALLYWNVIREATMATREIGQQVESLEHMLALDYRGGNKDELIQLQPAMLWEAYTKYAQMLGNEIALLVGDEQSWFENAATLVAASPRMGRAMYAMLTRTAEQEELRNQSHREFVRLLLAERFGGKTLQALYLDTQTYPQVEQLPDFMRYKLADQALETGNYALASRLLNGLAGYQEGEDPLDGQMRLARIHVLAGEHAEGARVLRVLLEQTPTWTANQLDHLMQVLFDIQGVGQHELVLDMFQRVLQKAPPVKQQREIYFWMGDSMKELAHYADAARLYLQSAGLLDATSMDMWAQSSRFQAAEMLRKAGMKEDARSVYQSLLKVTSDPQRRDMLEHSLRQL